MVHIHCDRGNDVVAARGECATSAQPRDVPKDHVWFEDRWMVASRCDE
jgi:hypothetical protein